jgi:hypothetical protein
MCDLGELLREIIIGGIVNSLNNLVTPGPLELVASIIFIFLQTILDEFVIPSASSLDFEVRKEAVRALGCFCLRSVEASKQHVLLVLQMAHLDAREVRFFIGWVYQIYQMIFYFNRNTKYLLKSKYFVFICRSQHFYHHNSPITGQRPTKNVSICPPYALPAKPDQF